MISWRARQAEAGAGGVPGLQKTHCPGHPARRGVCALSSLLTWQDSGRFFYWTPSHTEARADSSDETDASTALQREASTSAAEKMLKIKSSLHPWRRRRALRCPIRMGDQAGSW